MRQPLDLLALRPWLILAAFVVFIAAVGGLRDPASRTGSWTDAATYALRTCPPETDKPTPDDDIPPERSEPMETCSRVVR